MQVLVEGGVIRGGKSLPRGESQASVGRKRGGLPMHSYLLERIRQPDQRRLAPRAPDEREIDRQAPRLAHRHADARISRHRGRRGAPAGEVVAVDQVGRPGRIAGRRHDGVELVLVHDRVEPLAPGEAAAGVERPPVRRAS